MRTIKNIAIIVLIIIAGYWLVARFTKLPSIGNLFTSQPVVIDKTPIVITEIRSIAQLVTVTAYDEVVVDSLVFSQSAAMYNALRVLTPLAALPSLQKQLVLIGRGKVMAGVDLKKIDSSHISVQGDSLAIQLPPAEILDVIINPGDFETFEEKGAWSDADVTTVKLKVRQKMEARAREQNILTRANQKARNTIQAFMQGTGYRVVTVTTRGE